MDYKRVDEDREIWDTSNELFGLLLLDFLHDEGVEVVDELLKVKGFHVLAEHIEEEPVADGALSEYLAQLVSVDAPDPRMEDV